MDDNKAKHNEIKGLLEDSSSQKPDEVFQLMTKSMEFVKELMEENEKLRYRVVQIQEENRELAERVQSGERAQMLREKIKQLEHEKERIAEEYKKVENENKNYAGRYVEIEEENNNLAHLYVCSFQLHSTLDFNEVVRIIMEIIINLIGAENFGIFLLDEKTQTLKPIAMEGFPKEKVKPIPVGEGIIGKSVVTGENYFDPSLASEEASHGKTSWEDPLVSIPLKIQEKVIGVIVLYKLLPQKKQFANVDYELFTLLAGHAATAIFSAKLYSEAQRKLHTIKGFMDLLTSSEE
ncbi:MAG: GAF domain-containing protein [bacterium]